jgi:putative membrane-bound dehydrogenase-like protein
MKHWPLFLVTVTFLTDATPLSAAPFAFPGQTLTVPDGFEIERVAGPPLVDRPIAAAFDEAGCLYVSNSSGSNDKSDQQLKDRPHQILRLEDTDGDGKFDRRTVFADKMMFPEGVMWRDGSLYVGAPPSIWKLTDRDGDGVADERVEWHEGKTLTGCANDMHGPYAGPDGWIYWCKGAFAEQTYDLGNGKMFKSRASHIFRKRADGTGLEAVMTGGMDNPVDVTFTAGGERFFTTTFVHQPEAGKRDGLVHAVYGGVYGKVNSACDGHPRTGELMPVMMLWGPAAPCGLTRVVGRGLGADYQENLLACLFNLHKVTRHQLSPDGATFRSATSDFVASDNTDFHPTDVLEDADGSVLVVDTGGWYKLCCPTSQLAKPDVLGAIYRIRRKGVPALKDPRGQQFAWAQMRPAELTRLLGDERVAVAERATESLAKLGAAAVSPLRKALAKSNPVALRRNAVWALTRIDAPDARKAARAALQDPDATVRSAAIHSASVRRDHDARKELLNILAHDAPGQQRAAAEALGRFGDRACVPALFSAVVDQAHADRFLEHSLLFAMIELDDAPTTRSYLHSDDLVARRAALIALDQMPSGALKPDEVTPLLGSSSAPLRQSAWWVVGHHAEWGTHLSGYVRERLAGKLSPAEEDELVRQLAQLSRATAIQEVLVTTLREGGRGNSRLLTLRAMAQSGLKETPAAWLDEVARVLQEGPSELLPAAVGAARSFTLPKTGHPGLANALLEVALREKVPAGTRLEALAAVPGGVAALNGALFDFVRANLEPARPVPARAAATTILTRATLDQSQLAVLADSLQTVGPLELPRLLTAFEKKPHDESLGLKVVASLKACKRAGLREDLVRPLLTNFPPAVAREGESLLLSLNADAGKQKARLETLLTECRSGDVRRGQAIFNSTKAACSSCHAIGYLGGRVGPDLTSIGQVRTERDLLESIIYPSSSFVRSYEPMIVATKSGEEHSGVLRRDSPEEVILATGPEVEVRLARAEIAEMRPGTVSLMPQGLEEQLSRQELADLLAFLKNTKWGAQ